MTVARSQVGAPAPRGRAGRKPDAVLFAWEGEHTAALYQGPWQGTRRCGTGGTARPSRHQSSSSRAR